MKSGICLIFPAANGSKSGLINQAVTIVKSGGCLIDQAAAILKLRSFLIDQAIAILKSGACQLTR